jgi:hypothetical protein
MVFNLRALFLACAAAVAQASVRGGANGAALAARSGERDELAAGPPKQCKEGTDLLGAATHSFRAWEAAAGSAGRKVAKCVLFTKEQLQKHLETAATSGANALSADGDVKKDMLSVAFVAKTAFPAGTKVSLFGDLHGALSSFLAELKSLIAAKAMNDKLEVQDGHALVFCGDLLDRGPYSIEVFALALLLRTINPGSVFVGRGNHEENRLWKIDGLEDELSRKYGVVNVPQLIPKIEDVCNTLYVALFFSVENDPAPVKWALAAHGGFEPSGSVKEFLSKPLSTPTKTIYAAFGATDGPAPFLRKTWRETYFFGQKSFADKSMYDNIIGKYYWSEQKDDALLYMWSDIDTEERISFWNDLTCTISSRCVLSKRLIMLWMSQNNVITMFRGHQHNGVAFTNINK